jgi:N-sulfoglucosamine sulfohydrolase
MAKLSLRTLAALLFLLLCQQARGAERPNILLILSDDHSVPHLGSYGSPNAVTPHLDAFAAQSMQFNRAYTTAPQCAPSRASIYTGRSPVAVGSSRFPLPARREHVFFTDVLRQSGYWVGLEGRDHHLGGRTANIEHEIAGLAAAGLRYLEERFDYVSSRNRRLVKATPAVPFNEALDQVPEGKPFFLYFGFPQPHRTFDERPDGMRLFDPARLKLPPDFPDLPEVRADYANYLYTIYLLDRGFEDLMEALEERGLAQNTIVIFMGDNGEALLRGKGTLYERGNHVPLIIRWPGVVEAGSQSDVLVSGEDLAGTLLEAVGLPVPQEMTGISFLPALKGEPFAGRDYVFTERGWHWGPITRVDGLDFSRAITSRRYKLIYNLLPDRAFVPVDMVNAPAWRAIVEAQAAKALSPLHERLLFQRPRPILELYDLEADPYELNNLAGQEGSRDIEMKLRIELANWMVREGDFLPIPSLNYPQE